MALIAGTFIILFIALASSCEKANIKRKKAKLARIRYRIGASFLFLLIMAATVVAGLLEVAYDVMLFTLVFAGVCVLEGLYMLMFYVLFNRKVSFFIILPSYTNYKANLLNIQTLHVDRHSRMIYYTLELIW